MTGLESVDVQRLRWFVAVAQELHFARAAKSLNISRQKLSNTVIDLERELDTKLFVPGASPTELTDAGREYLRSAHDLVARADAEAAEPVVVSNPELHIGFVSGVTVTKWTRTWAERFPEVPLQASVVEVADQVASLHDRRIDVGFLRLPVDREGLSVIPLYREQPVVLVPKEHAIAAFDELRLSDLADEQLHNADDLDSIESTIELVAAGVGVVIVPHSIARLHARKDLVYRTVVDAPATEIAVSWLSSHTTDHIEEFIGIVRGRSERSSRSSSTAPKPQRDGRKKPATQPAKGKKQTRRR
ncbi:LysR family transcriptional regulator [Antrihabitans sp. YC2-6]|uniref:LysR family transcriptional regulator n=1 Tax=Antrihabitans sp. YC2-6 TaxID=2799498 RepID=UPI0018F64DBC|nr:LysR family transcriptional regulator [Antrihabitans sp. YC2-6]MBJ8346433.1 LysR family transcriptional regulator [Antrihabitans sp. YC2-6]